jgi:glycosyltransferase involved in cell wall biosynthesis
MGLPVVTTSIGYSGIRAERNREIFVEDQPTDFAKRVLELIRSDKLRSEISTKARGFIENNYSWEESISKLEFSLLSKVKNKEHK